MITSFTDPRLRVWNVGDNAICGIAEGDQVAAFPCYIGTIAEHVHESGVRSFAVDVFVAIPATPQFEIRTLRFGPDRLYTSFPSYLREMALRASDAVDRRNGDLIIDNPVVEAIRGASRSLRFETFQTLANWHTFLVDFLAKLERDDGIVAVMLRGLSNAIAAEVDRRRGEFEQAVLPAVATSTNTTSTTSTTNTTNTTPPFDVRHPQFEQQQNGFPAEAPYEPTPRGDRFPPEQPKKRRASRR